MVDSVQILPPGWRAFDNNGNLVTDGILSFFDAGTSDAKTVYSDAALSTSLGTTVNCNSAGYPVTSGNAKTLIYTGSDPYKIRLSSVLFGGTIFEHDNVRGALDTSTFLTSAAVADIQITNVTTDRAVEVADKGALLDVDPSAGTIVVTLDPPSDLGDGFFIGIRHAGTANQVRIACDGVALFDIPGASAVAFALTGRGQTVWLACDGVGFTLHSEVQPLIQATTGVILIADRLATPPASPNPGQRYIVTSGPTGAWSTFAEHDIAEATGAGTWFKYTPPSNCGWIAYVQDENFNYQYKNTAWVTEIASESLWGLTRFATNAEMEAQTVTLAVQPSTQHRHPGHPKFWARVNVSGGTPTLATSYNVTSITDTGEGALTVTIATDFSSANWCGLVASENSSRAFDTFENAGIAAGTVLLQQIDNNAAAQDPLSWHVVGYGDQ